MTFFVEDATHETFEPLIGSTFDVAVQNREPIPLVLENVKLYSEATRRDSVVEIEGKAFPARRAFGLTLVGPHAPLIPPDVYLVTHPELGEMAVFVSVFRQDTQETLYEILFN